MEMKRKGEWLEINIPAEWKDSTIEDVLLQKWQAPKGLLHQWRMDKGVRVNGETVRWSHPLQAGQRLQVHLFKEEDYGVVPEYLPLEPLYEDDHLLVINKPVDMDTHPNQEHQGGTLANAVAYHWQVQGLSTKVRHIHRLDRDTTGGVIFAKHALSGAMLDRMLSARVIKRTYVAFAHGLLKQQKGKIDQPIGRDRHHPTRRRVSERGDQAITHFRLIELFRDHHLSLVELQLETGRTHQIRVHMSHIGHPLVGDHLYGGKVHLFPRQALHAGRIELLHPLTGQNLNITVPWPNDLLDLLNKVKTYTNK
ncbi:RluA family pseudouridine synthase [Ammoniphilus sp. CFH 90114]|uniref:RluA family pseudouridine synthase n=1 Tax=Ammoniphilus sp. CFH 90114 TaxID=2493665 RepID=UPI00100DF2DD|nr:RluA family pseudouridine synthase [Ammoniphilus sp. CFH 90114]RXT08057.1 RluA family pseudouridine synthase [Ammoniphilus sp. CFH 90114]